MRWLIRPTNCLRGPVGLHSPKRAKTRRLARLAQSRMRLILAHAGIRQLKLSNRSPPLPLASSLDVDFDKEAASVPAEWKPRVKINWRQPLQTNAALFRLCVLNVVGDTLNG
jgi:hypothetical protein